MKNIIIILFLFLIITGCSHSYGKYIEPEKKISIFDALNINQEDKTLYGIFGQVIFENTNGTFFINSLDNTNESILILFDEELPNLLGRKVYIIGNIVFRISEQNYIKAKYLRIF